MDYASENKTIIVVYALMELKDLDAKSVNQSNNMFVVYKYFITYDMVSCI